MAAFGTLYAANAQVNVMGSEDFGRIFNLTYDQKIENRIYAHTIGNHIVFSNDNGENWAIFYSNPSEYVKDLKYYEKDDVLTFTTSKAIHFLDKNSGQIIKEINLPNPDPMASEEDIENYEVWGQNADVILVAQSYLIGSSPYSKAQFTMDGGQTWQEIYYSDNFNKIQLNNVAISPNNNQKLFLALANGSKNQHGGILISNDGGFNWDYKLEGTTFNPMAYNPENPNEIYAGSWIKINPEHSQGLYKSTDGGETWNILPIAWTDYIMDHIGGIHIDPKNSNHILVLEENEIVHTTDGGLSWQSEVYQDAYDNADSYVAGVKASYNPFDQNEIMITSDYYPFKSSDNGATIEKIKSPYFNGYGNMKYFDNGTESHLYYGVQYGFVHRDLQTNVDTPYNVRPLNSQSANRGARVEIDANVAGRIMTLTPGLSGSQIKLSFDHGATQQMIASAFVDEFNAFASHSAKQNIMWASFSFSGDSPELYQIDA